VARSYSLLTRTAELKRTAWRRSVRRSQMHPDTIVFNSVLSEMDQRWLAELKTCGSGLFKIICCSPTVAFDI